ncbi:alpha-N-arabinofuranosidase [Lacisediminihabitans profunda]|uniref:non-reducing end alpha-L-arabinofuranosidase n=1 Tax=Lacisediminihabitans profunda TaxID=2594790 RepID=A0A5C8UUZ1_9MICO|nr:alpha-N-arabinofuranosidase [Lacisediminihabitans profunda]TXN32464.1 alpha-N-arabinofuranosidase [Lacisediminihabitans profunda]
MPTAHLTLDPSFTVGAVNRRLFGSFVEHLGRCVYDGIYEPGHATADENGFREDVLDLVRELGVSTIRYPGGNFVSGFRWEDSVGPRAERPKRLDLAWHSTESNQVGLEEFSVWLEKAGSDLMYAVNLGTRGVQEALDVLEYSNIRSGTKLSDERVANGRVEPYDVRMWCLGNEMDGPWQLGHRSADDYGKLASQTAKAMRQVDPSLELVVCGSSSAHMPTFGSWERTVLEHTYDDVDFISCHAYYEEKGGDTGSFLASAVDMDHFIESVVATADHVKAVRGSDKTINISFDEWNVWYIDRYHSIDKIEGLDNWPEAPRLLEDVYSVADAVVFGSLLISLLNHADRVTSASLAQLVNVIAPIMTEPGGDAWRQTTFYPFSVTSRLASGTALSVKLASDTYETKDYGTVNVVDAAATFDGATGSVFLVNRSQTEPATVTIDARALGSVSTATALTLADDDINAANTLADQNRVGLSANDTLVFADGTISITLPPVSWTAVSLG